MDVAPAQSLQFSFEAIASVGTTVFIAAVSAAWVLLRAMVFNPLRELSTELRRMNVSIQNLATKQLEIERTHSAKLEIHEYRLNEIQGKLQARHPEVG